MCSEACLKEVLICALLTTLKGHNLNPNLCHFTHEKLRVKQHAMRSLQKKYKTQHYFNDHSLFHFRHRWRAMICYRMCQKLCGESAMKRNIAGTLKNIFIFLLWR